MSDPYRPFPLPRAEFVVMMAGLMALNALAIDIMLPALGLISTDYALTDPNDRQWVISLYVFGMGSGSILYGSLSDRYGRKPVMAVTLGAYVIFAIVCAMSESYELMLAARFAQGFAAAATGVLANSIVRDLYVGDAMARMMSTIMMIFLIVPVIAPMVGQLVLVFAPWPVIFTVLAAMGSLLLIWAMLRLPETLRPEDVIPIKPYAIVATWRTIVSDRSALGHVLASGLMMAPLFAFVTTAQQVFFDVFDAADIFVFVFGVNAGGMAIANFVNSRIVERFGARRVSQSALLFFICVSILHLALVFAEAVTLPIFVILLALAMAMVGFTGANFSSIAMQPFGRMAGAASSFQNFVRTLTAMGIAAGIGLQFDGTVLPLILGFVVCGLLSFASVYWAEGGEMFRRRQAV